MITKFENFDSAVCMTPLNHNYRLSKSTSFTSSLFFHDTVDVFTPKRFSLTVPSKATKDK